MRLVWGRLGGGPGGGGQLRVVAMRSTHRSQSRLELAGKAVGYAQAADAKGRSNAATVNGGSRQRAATTSSSEARTALVPVVPVMVVTASVRRFLAWVRVRSMVMWLPLVMSVAKRSRKVGSSLWTVSMSCSASRACSGVGAPVGARWGYWSAMGP